METTKPNPAPPQHAPATKKPRRVGTFTFGLVLIAAGVLTILFLLVPGFDLVGIVKFSPVVLIFLGVEVLVYAARPGVVVQYDFLGMLACAFILVVVGGASAVAYLGLNFGPAYDYSTQRLESAVKTDAYKAFSADPALRDWVSNVDASVHLNRAVGGDGTADALQPGDRCILNVRLLAAHLPDEAAFGEAAQKIIDAVGRSGVPVTNYIIETVTEQQEGLATQTLSLSGDAAWLTGLSAAQLAERSSCDYYLGNEIFPTAADRDNALKEQYREEILAEYQSNHDDYPGDEYLDQKLAERFATPETAQ